MKSVYNKTISGSNSLTDSLNLSVLTDSSGNDINQIVQQQITNLVSGEFAADELILNSLQANSAFKNIDNTFTGNNTFTNIPTLSTDLTASVTNDLQLTNKKYCDDKVYSLYTRDNVFFGDNKFDLAAGHNLTTNKLIVTNSFTAGNDNLTFKTLPQIDSSLVYTANDYSILPKKDIISLVLGSDNTFTGTNTINKLTIPNFASIDSTNATTNTNITGNTTFTGNLSKTSSFEATTNEFNFKALPQIDSSLVYTANDYSILPKKDIISLVNNISNSSSILGSDNTFTGTNTINKLTIPNFASIDSTNATTNTNITGNTTFTGNLSKTSSFEATSNAFDFKALPTLNAAVTYSSTADNNILPKKEVNNLITVSNRYKMYCGDSTICYIQNTTTNKICKCPYIAMSNNTLAGASVLKKSIYFNFPTNATGAVVAGSTIIGTKVTTIKVKYILVQNKAVLKTNGNYTSDNYGTITRPGTQFNDLDFKLLSATDYTNADQKSSVFYFEASMVVGLMRDADGNISPYVKPLAQSTPNIILSTAGSTDTVLVAGLAYKMAIIQYDTTTFKFYPIMFEYDTSKSKLKMNFHLPNILNDPARNGFISSYDFYVEIDNGFSSINVLNTLPATNNIPSVYLSDD